MHPVSEMNQDITIGAVVQLVRIHACHAWGRGFESRPHRKKEMQNASLFFVALGQRELANTHNAGRGFESRPHRKKEMQSASLFFVVLGQRELANTYYTTAALLSSPRLLATPPHKVTLPALAQKSTFLKISLPLYLPYFLQVKDQGRTKDEPRNTERTPYQQKVLFVK